MQSSNERRIRSFVLRQGRMTEAQERAFSEHWQRFGIDIVDGLTIDSRSVFGDDRELVLEIGFGNGASLIEMAEAAPELGFIGIEVHKPGVGRAINAAADRDLRNIKFIRFDAVEVLQKNIVDGTLSRVQIYFPDPWQKARHHKRRLIQKPFTDLVFQKLRVGGEIHCATDWENYAEWMRDVFISDKYWKNLGNDDGFAPRPDFRPLTKFENRGLNLGHGVWDLRFQKDG